MPNVSQQKKDKISEQILHHLFSVAPQSLFTAEIAREIARDEEFTKYLLGELKSQGLIAEVAKNGLGQDYLRRRRWRLSNLAFEAYSKQQ
ncbi:hypothetical protein J4233_00545 [Candidatus Pacearchaeota archaeon]|nr:hypothetical protein [Candidatus Pacearchaeota archaeon]